MSNRIIAVEPMGAPRMTQRDRWKERAVVERYKKFKDTVRDALPADYRPGTVLKIEFHIAMPKSYSKKKRAELAGQYHQQKPDNDNMQKAFLDIWKRDRFGKETGWDDSVVAIIHAGKYWCSEGEAPCIIIEI
jgi:Holliday junction resolvase RusA-like endonuclease